MRGDVFWKRSTCWAACGADYDLVRERCLGGELDRTVRYIPPTLSGADQVRTSLALVSPAFPANT